MLSDEEMANESEFEDTSVDETQLLDEPSFQQIEQKQVSKIREFAKRIRTKKMSVLKTA